MKNIVLFDLDGTLALIDHRRHLVENGAKRWREFYAACPDDKLNVPVAEMFQLLRHAGYKCWIVSGRSDEVYHETIVWLAQYNLMFEELIMRDQRDHQPDVSLKRSWLHTRIPREDVLCVYDDRSSVVAMWREEGLTCFQVAPGDF